MADDTDLADGPGIIRDETGTQRTLGYVLDVGAATAGRVAD